MGIICAPPPTVEIGLTDLLKFGPLPPSSYGPEYRRAALAYFHKVQQRSLDVLAESLSFQARQQLVIICIPKASEKVGQTQKL